MKTAFVFPGQGSQVVGMGQRLAGAFPVARDTFDEINEALQQNLSHIMWEGPEETLTLTENAQPALMAVSLAVIRVLEKEGGLDLKTVLTAVAGHSLGEYSALAAAKTFSIADTARLLKLRGQAMQKAVPVGKGAMAAILGLDYDVVEALVKEAAGREVCALANDNSPGQIVISGDKAAVERASELAKEKGAKRALMLPVSAPFHCSLMEPAAEAMQHALEKTILHTPVVPLYANVTAAPVTEPQKIRDLLVQQVTGSVRWRESVTTMFNDGMTRFVEVGTGKVLSGLIKRIAPEAKTLSVGTPEEIEALLKDI